MVACASLRSSLRSSSLAWLALMLAAVVWIAAARPASASTVPPSFVDSTIASGLATPTSMAFAPDGRIFVTEQGGRLRVIKNGVLLATPFLTVTVNSAGERGLLGVAFDPAFATNGFVYVYYTATTPAIHNRVSRFVANGDVAVAGSETVLLDLNNLSSATNHNGGAIHFGPDGKLYIAVGENANSANSQSFANLLGKLLRINPDGTIPSDNPFLDRTTGQNRAIWAMGLRNPFTFAFQPGTGRMFINDVGQNTWEEIDDGIAGSNYGWPNSEGPTTRSGERSPLYWYGHGTGAFLGCAITGGAFYDPPVANFPAQYQGTYFFADFCGDWINRYDPATGNVTSFASNIAAPVDLHVGPDGRLYYLARGSGTNTGFVGAIGYVSGPAATTTSLASSANPSTTGNPVTFTATVNGTNPTGSVSFTADGGPAIANCATVALGGSGNARTAQCTTSTLSAGTHSIVARYSGDSANQASTSNTVSQVVQDAQTGYTNVALASAGGVATASSTASGYSIASINNGDRTGVDSRGGRWKDNTSLAYPDWAQITFAGARTIDKIIVYTVRDDYTNPVEPTDTMTGTAYALLDFTVQVWNGTSWVVVGTATNNNLIKRTFTFPQVTTDRIRVNVTRSRNGFSRITELEAFGFASAPPPPPESKNVALAANGGVASASSVASGYTIASINNGDRTGVDSRGGRWKDNTSLKYPDWAQVTFAAPQTIDKIIVYTVRDDYTNPVEPTDTMTGTAYALLDYTVEVWNGASWVVVGSITNNNLIKRTFTFPKVSTDRVRVNVTRSRNGFSRVTELEAWTSTQ